MKSRGLNSVSLASILKACGNTLEEIDISITPTQGSAEVVDAIRNYCEQLCVIDIDNLEQVIDVAGQECYMSLICSYGSHLKNASTEGLCYERLVEVVNACANLEFNMDWKMGETFDWRRVYHVGLRVSRIGVPADVLYGYGCVRAFKQCSNLRELSMFDTRGDPQPTITDEMIANVFSASCFPKLEHLHISGFKATEHNMALIASCTANLQSAVFEPFDLDLDVSVFKIIADSNTHLNDISIDTFYFREPSRSAQSAFKSLDELMNMFRKCRHLWLKVSCSDGEEEEGEEVGREDLIRIAIFRLVVI